MKTNYEEIVSINHIGEKENPIALGDILKKAGEEDLTPSSKCLEKVLLLGIDVQQDFMDNGALGVPNAKNDVANITRFIYNNMDSITNIAVSIDTHTPQQIFHPCWWVDQNGNHPAPFTVITLQDLDDGKWQPVYSPIKSREYVQHLEQDAKKNLCIWSYHCIQGTDGCALDNQFANMIYFHSVAKNSIVQRFVKGQDPFSEMYSIIKPEYDTKGYINMNLLNQLEKYDKVIVCGEASSHCVMETVKHILEFYKDKKEVTKKIYILEDCMSPISGFEQTTKDTFDDFKKTYGINIVKSTDLKL